jgi:NAD(P)-dependent dehydrogenase (short-subunit alcohol dehydrogenase family)
MARVFITGSTDGLGLAAAQSLLARGHQLVLHARSAERAARAGDVASRASPVVIGDLASAAQTREVADQVNALGRMDAVIHNAGIYTEPVRGATPEGHATVLAVNTLAPYILTALIHRPKRLVYLSSGLHRGGEGSLEDLDWTERPWEGAKAYAESKLHVAAIAAALARRWPDVSSSAVDPGWVRTRMGGASAPLDLETGQRTQTWLAVSDEPEAQVSGGYWHDLRRQEPASEVTDQRFQDRLLERLAEMTGVSLP